MAFGRVGAGFGRVGLWGGAGGASLAGGAALLAAEANGFAADFTHAVDAQRVALKTAGAVVSSGLSFFTKSTGSVKWVYDVTGALVSVSAASPAVDYDPVTHAARGMLVEPAATNLLLNNATLSTQSVTVTATTYTLSIFGTGTVTLSGTSTAGPLVGTGANNRVSLTFAPTAGTLTLTVSGSVTKAQLETGGIATSPITTVGSAVTRAADVISATATAIHYSATAGSWWVDISLNTTGSFSRIIGYSTADTPMLVQAGLYFFDSTDGTNIVVTVADVLGRHKIAGAFQSGDRALTADGQAPGIQTVATGLLAPGTNIGFGCNTANNADQINGYIRKVMYVPRRMTNGELQALTV